jgi:predicted Zn-dependent protease
MKQHHFKQAIAWTVPLLTAAVIFMSSPSMIMGKTDDVILQAMKDELDRSMKSLKIENMEKPYYLEYSIWDNWVLSIEGSFGALTNSREGHQRILKVGIRVGSYQLDNTGFIDRSSMFSSVMGRHGQVVVEDDYNAIRRDIWLATDRTYKDALQQLASKKAYIKNQVQTEEIPDFSKEEKVQKIAPRVTLKVDKGKWEKIVTQLSTIFRKFPALHESQVNMRIELLHKYFVNSEGTVFCQPHTLVSLVAHASTQAADGMKLKHYIPFYATSLQQMPSEKELAAGINKMAEGLTALASAPVLEEYIGPVLFTQQASAELFTQVLAPHLSGQRPPLSNIPQNFGMTTFSSKLTQRLNRKILPREISITDNPLQSDFNQAPLIGSYNIDDEGVAAKPVNLVEKGNLKTLLMSRRPREEISQSNGHGRSSFRGNPGTQIGNLLITTEKGKTYQELKKELLELCKDQGLDFGLIIKTVDNPAITGMESTGFGPRRAQTETAMTTPVMLFRVYAKDGREELVRGLTVSELSVSDLKDITAVGKDYYVLNRMVAPAGTGTGSIFFFYITRAGTSMTIPASIVAPSVLFEELEFKKSEEKRQKTPLMTHPFFGK